MEDLDYPGNISELPRASDGELVFALSLGVEFDDLPEITLNPQIRDLFRFRYEDFTLSNYEHHPHIKGVVAV